MLHVSTQKLIIKLCELTEQGAVAWREGETGVLFETEGYVVELADDPSTVRVLRADGRELERADAADLAAARWPGGQGVFAEHVAIMSAQAQRIARGTEQAIARILTSLSAPPQLSLLPEPPEPVAFSTDGGSESEASMAAAVADMAERLRRQPLETAQPPAPTAAAETAPEPPVVEEEARPQTILSPPPLEPAAESQARAVRAAPKAATPPRPAEFGRTRSFSIAPRHTHHRPSPEPRPVAARPKITATGLLLTGISATSVQTVSVEESGGAEIEPALPPAKPAPDMPARPAPPPASPDAYKPWA